MLKISLLYKKSVMLGLIAALLLLSIPVAGVSAAGFIEATEPPSEETQASNERLEKVWERLQQLHKRQGRVLERTGEVSVRIQARLDEMNNNGKDTAAMQAALDAFEQALEEAQPLYTSAGNVISAHAGFDAQGEVIDREQAITTVKELNALEKEIRQLVGQPGKALREAIKAYREAQITNNDP